MLFIHENGYYKIETNLVGFKGKNLSGGEKKKIQLINAICRDAEVIIFDEPTNTLDSTAINGLMNLLNY